MKDLYTVFSDEETLIDNKILIRNKSKHKFDILYHGDKIQIILGYDNEGPYYKTIDISSTTVINIEVKKKDSEFSKIYLPDEISTNFSANNIYRLNLLETEDTSLVFRELKLVGLICNIDNLESK